MKQSLRNNTILSSLGIAAGALAMLAMPCAAQAQIDEVVTTAQRREQSTQDVPVAVTVLSSVDLETKQIGDTLDIQNFVPNLNIGTNTGTANAARIFLRGIGEDESRGAVEPAVGTYIDGVYIGRLVGSLLDLVDLEQVEVLRGPQGTLYGRNSNGGAIKISTIKPQAENGFSGKFTYGNNDRMDVKGTANLAVSDSTAIRVSGLYKSRDGFFDIIPNGAAAGEGSENVGDIETMAFRGAISQDIGDWNVLITADYTDDDSEPTPSSVLPGLDGDNNVLTVEPSGTCATPGAMAPAGPFQFTRPVGCFNGFSNETKSQGISGTITGELGGHRVQSISSFRRLDDELSSHIGFPFAQQTDQEQFSQEITLSSQADGPFNYVVGGFYFREDLNLDSDFVFPFRVASDTESFAVFGQGSYAISDRATLTAGLRYTDESRDFGGINFSSGLTNAAKTSSDNVSYTMKFDYDVNDNVMGYASYSTGFKGSGFSPDCFGPTACFLPVTEEEVKTIEVGMKSQIWDNRLQFNATYFHNDYDDLQIAASVPGLGFTRFNVDKTEIQGFEFDLRFKPTERFELIANLGLLDGEYKDLTEAQAGGLSNNSAGCPGSTVLAGQALIDCALNLELKNAPDYKANIAAIYTHPIGNGALTFSGDISFEDDSFNLVANSPASAFSNIPTLLNGRIAFSPDDSFWNVSLWAKNITDEEYWRAGTGTGVAVYAAEPATYGVDIGFNF
ncbi:MAG: TonB-dependent receptor [Hellea sp.]